MALWTKVKCLFWLGLFLFFSLSSVWGANASKITLKDGSVFENVEFHVNKRFKTISIVVGEDKKYVSFTEVQQILDENGTDVTSDYIGTYVEPVVKESQLMDEQSGAPVDTEDWESETDPRRIVKQKPPWSVSIQLGADFTIPTGDFYDGIRSGLGFGGDFIFAVSKNIGLRFTLSKSGMRDDAGEIASGYIVLDDQLDVNVWRYFFSVQYFTGPDWTKNQKVGFYGFGGLGAVSHNTSGEMLVQDPVTDSLYVIFPLEKNQTKFALTSGFGIVTTVAPKFGFEFESTLDYVFIGSSNDSYTYFGYGNVQSALVIDFRVGLVMLL